MKNVVLHRSELLAIVPDDDVFLRPLADPPGMPNPAQEHEDQQLRYAAWHACRFVIGGASVYAGVCGGHKCYVVLPNKVYNPDRRPQPVRTKDEDDLIRTENDAARRREEKRAAAEVRRNQQRARYEIIPKTHAGVNYGTEQRVLIRTKTHVLTWKPGSSSYLDRGAGSVYQRGEFCVMPYEKAKGPMVPLDADGTNKLGYRCIFAGPGSMDIPAPHDFRMSPKNLIAQFDGFEAALKLKSGTLKASGWSGEKTLVLT